MKYLLLFVFSIGFCSNLFAQQTLPQLTFQSSRLHLEVSQAGSVSLTTRAGEFAHSRYFGASFSVVDKAFGRAMTDRSNFFNNDTGVVSGFISSTSGKYNLIYHTQDGGNSWKQIDFGQDGWVDGTSHLDDGRIWMSVAGNQISYSSDFGFTWSTLPSPEPLQRYETVFFLPSGEGMLGSLWNRIFYTKDNCKSWTHLTTPLDQKKYRKTSSESRPEINHVAILGNHFLVIQQGLVFSSRKDSIDWKLLPYSGFFSDNQSNVIFFSSEDGLLKCDSNLNVVGKVSLAERSFLARLKNEKLYVYTDQVIRQINEDLTKKEIAFMPQRQEQNTMTPIFYSQDHKYGYGVSENQIWKNDLASGAWSFHLATAFDLERYSLGMNKEEFVIWNKDSVYMLNAQGKIKSQASQTEHFKDFENSPIDLLSFINTSSGCFHHEVKEQAYRLLIGEFVESATGLSTRDKPTIALPNAPYSVSIGLVDDFLKSIPDILLHNNNLSYASAGFSSEDLAACRKNVEKFIRQIGKGKSIEKLPFQLYKNNIDDKRLLAIVDSLPRLQGNLMDRLQQSYLISTSSTSVSIGFRNRKGEVMSFRSTSYLGDCEAESWTLSYKGVGLPLSTFKVYDFVRSAYPGLIGEDAKVIFLQKLVAALY